MKGIIIAGGMGTRLRPLTYHRPKHLLPVANRPFLEYQVDLLCKHGIRDIVFASNYLWEQIQAHFGNGAAFSVSMQYAVEPVPLGTAGAIRNAAALAGEESVIVLNGDVLTDFDLASLIRQHALNNAEATIALRTVERPHAFGVVMTESDGRVREWREPGEEEKKRVAAGEFSRNEASGVTDHINAGIYILEHSFIERIPAGLPFSIERETYPQAISQGRRIYAVEPHGFWLDIGNPRQYLAANMAVLSRQVKTDLPPAGIHHTATIHSSARIAQDCSIGPNSVVGADTVIERSVILDGVRIGVGCRITGAILDSDVEIEDGRAVGKGDIISAGA